MRATAPGGAGFVLVIYGKNEEHWPSITALLGAGATITAALWYAVREGW